MITISHTHTLDEGRSLLILVEYQKIGITRSPLTGLLSSLVCVNSVRIGVHSLTNSHAEYALCQSGTQQSPINVAGEQVSLNHLPNFDGYANVSIPGNFFNWAFAPAWTPHHEEDLTTLPSFNFDDQEVFMIGWHIHTPAEHLVDGKRSRAELHLVHVTADDHEAAVVGIRLAVGATESAFFKQLPPYIHFNDTAQLQGLEVNMRLAIDEVGGVRDFWTYQGSLTTPPCSEGLRWFLAKQELMVSQQQMVDILAASRFSHRVPQEVWNHEINL